MFVDMSKVVKNQFKAQSISTMPIFSMNGLTESIAPLDDLSCENTDLTTMEFVSEKDNLFKTQIKYFKDSIDSIEVQILYESLVSKSSIP